MNLYARAVMAAGVLFTAAALRGVSPTGAAMPRLETQVLGQTEWLPDSTASLRVVTLNHITGEPVRGAQVRLSLAPAADPAAAHTLLAARTDQMGTLNASFKVPAMSDGRYRLTVVAEALGERDTVEHDVTLRSRTQIMLTTDKPVYQPGQTIHIRSLALRLPDLRPSASEPTTIEVEDAKGNKVFKKAVPTSRFGVAGTSFILADEVNMGRYRVRAIQGQATAEKVVTVDRYVLPKFRVALKLDKSYYLPGQTMAGHVQCDYFFGKPVAGHVSLVFSTFDVGFHDFGTVEGDLDGKGHFEFTQPVPSSLVGLPLEQGNALVRVEATVIDTADHRERSSTSVPVAREPITLIAVPESRSLTPGVENQVYVLASYPDGKPAQARVTLDATGAAPASASRGTDANGIAVFGITPSQPTVELELAATDTSGNHATARKSLELGSPEGLILRPDKAIYRVGDTMHLAVISPAKTGTVYVDAVLNRQTVSTTAVQLEAGRASADMTLGPELAGTLELHAYRLTSQGETVRDTQVVLVQPAADLNVAIRPDKTTYLPADKARLSFAVTDAANRGVAAALGVTVVDESVFAIEEMHPGMEKVYFLLEKEILEPRYEIHGLEPGTILSPGPAVDAAKQRPAKMLFASLPLRPAFTLAANSYAQKAAKLREAWLKRVSADAERIGEAISQYQKDRGEDPPADGILSALLSRAYLRPAQVRDEFGRRYVVTPWAGGIRNGVRVASLGPDGKQDTDDDVSVFCSPGPAGGSASVLPVPTWPVRRVPPFARRAGQMDWQDNSQVAQALGAQVPAEADGMLGGFGGIVARGAAGAEPLEMARARNAAAVMDAAAPAPAKASGAAPAQAAPEVRVRQFFPETMFADPSVITDDSGHATVEVPVADSITTWRISALASSMAGQIGSATAPLRVFQDFFVDIDFPVSLTQNDEVSVPVAVYNYLPKAQKVTLRAEKQPWFELLDDATKEVTVGPSEVKAVTYRIVARGLGFQRLTVRATGTQMSDAVRREVEVLPDGQRSEVSESGRLDKTVEKAIAIPSTAVKDASNILVKVYPGILSQVVEGMDKILQMPFGCFEQTSSTTYPNVLALGYMKSTNKAVPEVQMKAEEYINLGYQRLVSYEVAGGGFSWFGNAPANRVLTAYGLMEFADMAKVYEVDPSLIQRTQDWLAKQQEANGSWPPDKEYLHQESWGRIQHSEIIPTAYITWALAESGYTEAAAKRGADYVAAHLKEIDDAYQMALAANALVAAKHASAEAAIDRLAEMAVVEGDVAYWKSNQPTMSYAKGRSADLEATALAAYALVRSERKPSLAAKALTYLIANKDPNGTWYSTQATVLALKALLAAQDRAAGDMDARVRVLVNGQLAGEFAITPQDADVMRQVDAKKWVRPGSNDVRIEFSGKGSALYQISAVYYKPWAPPALRLEPLNVSVKYDRTELARNDIVSANVSVGFSGQGAANMVIVDLGIPPGFQVLSEDLQALVDKKAIQKYTVTGRQVIVYLERVESGKALEFSYRMRAKYPVRAKTPASVAYLYYNPEVRSVVQPVNLVVQ